MAQLEGNSGKKDVPAAGSKDPVSDASSSSYKAFGQGEAKATPAISDTPVFQTTLRQEETAAASKFAESVWKPLEREKDKDKDDVVAQQAYAVATFETPRAEVKSQVEVSKPAGSLLRTAHADEEQVINKLLATNTGDKGSAAITEKVVVDGGKKAIGPVTSLGAVADSITKEAINGNNANFKVSTNELKTASLGGVQEVRPTPRNDIGPLLKTEATNPLQKLDPNEGSSRAQRTFGLDATPVPRVESNPIIKTTQAFQPPDKIVSAGGGFFEIPDAKQKQNPDLGKPLGEQGKPVAEIGKSVADLGRPAYEINKPVYEIGKPVTVSNLEGQKQTQPSLSGDVTVNGWKNVMPTSYDMPPRLQTDKPAIVQSIANKQPEYNLKDQIYGNGVAPNVSVGKISDLQYGKADAGAYRAEPILSYKGAESLAPAIRQNVGSENIASRTFSNDFKSPSSDLKSQINDGAYLKRSEPIISKGEIYQAANQGQLKDLVKSGSADVGSINKLQTQGFEPGKPYNPTEGLKLVDVSKSAAALGVELKQGGNEGEFGKKAMFENSMQNAKSLSNSLQEPPRNFVDGGNGKPAIVFPKPIESQPLFKDPQIGSKPDTLKPFTTGPDYGSSGLGKIVDGGQAAPAGPGKFDKVIGGNEFKPPSDGVGILGKQPEGINKQQPGVTDSISRPGIPADGAGNKPGVVVNPADGSFKPVNPGTNAPEVKSPGTSTDVVPKPGTVVDVPKTAAPADVKPVPVAPKLDVVTPKVEAPAPKVEAVAPKIDASAPRLDAPKAPVTVGDTTKAPVVGDATKAPALVGDASKAPATVGDGTKAPAVIGDASKAPATVGDTNAPKTAVKAGDVTTVTDAAGKNATRTPAVDPVTAFEQSTQRVRQLADGRFDTGMRSGPLETALNGRVTQIRDMGADAKANVIDGAKNAPSARLDFDVRVEGARPVGTSRGIAAEGPTGRRAGETVVSGREPQVTSFEPQGKINSAKLDPAGSRGADVRDPQVRVDASNNPTAGIGRIPLSGSVRVADFQPGVSGQNVDGRVVGEVSRLPGVRGFGQVGDGASFTSHGEIRAPRGESHRYITGLELALILSIAGIAKIRHDARSGAVRLEGRTWSITRQNGRALIYVDGRQNPLQPQRAFGKGDGSFRIMVSTAGDQSAKLSTRTMRTTDIAQSKTTDASSANGLNLGLLGKFHYMNYFGKNMPSMNYYGQFRSTSYTGSMGLAFVMAASGMTRPAGGMDAVQGVDKLNPVTMGPADRIRMQNQSLLTQFGRFNLDAAVGASANGRDISQKEGRDEKQDNSLSVLDDYQEFLNRLDGFSKKKEETEDEAAIINRKLSFGVENLYDETSEDDKAEEIVDKDDTTGNALSQVLRRPKWVVQTGDTLDGLAERFFSNADLGWLIADLNRSLIRETYIDNKRIVEMQGRLEIELPVWQDIQKFNQNRKKNWTAENLVTIVVERQIDREVVESVLAKVVGAEA